MVEIYAKYKPRGLEILAFPSNQFGQQEPKSSKEIADFVKILGVTFPMMEKIDVNGPGTHEVYKALKRATQTEDLDISWNFEAKFLVSKDGKRAERYARPNPVDLISRIEELLNEPDV